METTVPINDLLAPIDLGTPIEMGSLQINYGLGTFTDWDLHGHVFSPGGVASRPFVEHANGVIDDFRGFIRNACIAGGLSNVTITWTLGDDTVSEREHKARRMMRTASDIQPYLCWLLNIAPKAIEIDRSYDYHGTIELPDKTFIRGANPDARLRVLANSAMNHHRDDWTTSQKERLGCHFTSILPHNDCESFAIENLELNGNYENNSPWIADPTGWDTTAIANELRDTPVWGGIFRTDHGGRTLSTTQRARLRDVSVHGYGSACILGGNNWRGDNVRTGNSLGNHCKYWANGDWTNLEIFGFCDGEYIRFSEDRVSNLIFRNGAANPWTAESFNSEFATRTGGDIAANWGQSLQREHQGVSIDGFNFDLRGTGVATVFDGAAYAFRAAHGTVRAPDGVLHLVLLKGNKGVTAASDVYTGTSLRDVLVIFDDTRPLLYGAATTPPHEQSPIIEGIQIIPIDGDAYVPALNGDASCYVSNVKKDGQFWDQPRTVTFRDIVDRSGNAFVLRLDNAADAINGIDIIFDRCHFQNSTAGVVVAPSNTGLSTALGGDHAKIRIWWRHSSFVIWSANQTNLELLWELSRFDNCRVYFGDSALGTVNWTCWKELDGVVSATPSPC